MALIGADGFDELVISSGLMYCRTGVPQVHVVQHMCFGITEPKISTVLGLKAW